MVLTNGKVVVKIYVTLASAEVTYHPVEAHRLALVRLGADGQAADSGVVTTDETGTVALFLEPGPYRLASLEPVIWDGRRYRWELPIDVRPAQGVVDLSAANAAPRPIYAERPAPALPAARAPAPQAYAFAKIPWGVSADSASRLLAGLGFRPAGGVGRDAGAAAYEVAGDLVFWGEIYAIPTRVSVLLSGGRTAKVAVLVYAPRHRTRRVYDEVKATLAARYGPPAEAHAESPGALAEGGTGAAGTTGGARAASSVAGPVAAIWWPTGGARGERLALEITGDGSVAVTYESPEWAAEAARRAARPTGDAARMPRRAGRSGRDE